MFSKSFYFVIFFSRKCFHQKNIRFQKHLYHVKKKVFSGILFSKKLIFLFFILKRNPNFAKKGEMLSKNVFLSRWKMFLPCEIFLKKNKNSHLKKNPENCVFKMFFFFYLHWKMFLKKMFSSIFIKIWNFFPKKQRSSSKT